MIDVGALFTPLALAGFVAGVMIAVVAGRVRGDEPGNIALAAFGSGLVLAALAWASAHGNEALFAALAVGLGATLWATAVERGRRRVIR